MGVKRVSLLGDQPAFNKPLPNLILHVFFHIWSFNLANLLLNGNKCLGKKSFLKIAIKNCISPNQVVHAFRDGWLNTDRNHRNVAALCTVGCMALSSIMKPQ